MPRTKKPTQKAIREQAQTLAAQRAQEARLMQYSNQLRDNLLARLAVLECAMDPGTLATFWYSEVRGVIERSFRNPQDVQHDDAFWEEKIREAVRHLIKDHAVILDSLYLSRAP